MAISGMGIEIHGGGSGVGNLGRGWTGRKVVEVGWEEWGVVCGVGRSGERVTVGSGRAERVGVGVGGGGNWEGEEFF